MTYFDEEEDYTEREPRTLPDMYIEPDATCGVCGVKNSVERPMDYVCSECGKPTHTECGKDTEPSGGWDRDWDRNYWMCITCLSKPLVAFDFEAVPAPIVIDEPLRLAADTGKREK